MPASYIAFISYSHRDEAFARWLHRRLEGWRISRDLAGRDAAFGPVPQKLRPIFRDRDDFSGAPSLQDATLAALRGSQAMIVICSAAAAASTHVDAEIREFRRLGRGGRIVPVIVPDAPPGPVDGLFPHWLSHEAGPDGEATGERLEPIAADARDGADGRQRAAAKVVAGLLGLPLDEILKREAQARRARNAWLAGLGTGAFVFATAFAAYALYQSYQAGVAIEKSLFSIGGMVRSTNRLPEDDEATSELRRGMLREQCDLIDALARGGDMVGQQERAICFVERMAATPDRPMRERLAAICAFRDELARVAEGEKEPDADETEAFVFTHAKTFDLIDDNRADAGDCSAAGAGGGDPHLRHLLDRLNALSLKRADSTYLLNVHESATWRLIEELEKVSQWEASRAAMQVALDMRTRQMDGIIATEPVAPAALQQAVYLRRLSWLALQKLAQVEEAEALGSRAVAAYAALLPLDAGNADLIYQAALADMVHGDALLAAGRAGEAAAAFRAGIGRLQPLVERGSDQLGEEFFKLVSGDRAYLEQRLAVAGQAAP